MKFSLRNSLHLYALIWFCCLLPCNGSAQPQILETPVSLSVSNEPVAIALDRLTRGYGIAFSYNPDQIEAERKVSVKIANRPLHEVLAAILPPEKFGYKISGVQIVLYKLKVDAPVPETKEAILPSAITPVPIAVIPDTVFITRTETRTDTLFRTDTVTKHDTVYIMQVVTRDRPINSDDIFSNQINLSKEQSKDFAFEAGFSVTWLISETDYSSEPSFSDKADEYQSAHSGDLLSGAVSLDLRLSYARLSLESGIGYTGFNEKFNYNHEVKTGGFYLKDTLDPYYTLYEGDTTWFYVLDSTYLPVDLKEYRYKTGIQHRFIEIPMALQYNHPLGRMLVYAKAGIIASVHAGSKGFYILPEQEGVGQIAELEVRPVVFSWLAGVGILFPLNQNFTLNAGAIYRKQLQNIYTDFPIDRRFGAFGINAGIIYKF